jgi:hypothetical protein
VEKKPQRSELYLNHPTSSHGSCLFVLNEIRSAAPRCRTPAENGTR